MSARDPLSELLPCPFCSSPNPLLHRAPFAGSISGWRISCNYCDTSPGSRGSEAGASDLWNRRWPSPGEVWLEKRKEREAAQEAWNAEPYPEEATP